MSTVYYKIEGETSDGVEVLSYYPVHIGDVDPFYGTSYDAETWVLKQAEDVGLRGVEVTKQLSERHKFELPNYKVGEQFCTGSDNITFVGFDKVGISSYPVLCFAKEGGGFDCCNAGRAAGFCKGHGVIGRLLSRVVKNSLPHFIRNNEGYEQLLNSIKGCGVNISDFAYMYPEIAENSIKTATGLELKRMGDFKPHFYKNKNEWRTPVQATWVATLEKDPVPTLVEITYNYKIKKGWSVSLSGITGV